MISTVNMNPQQKRRHRVLSSLKAVIEAANLAKEDSSMALATAAFNSVSVLLTKIRVRFLFSDGEFLAHIQSELHSHRNRLRRARDNLRLRVSGSWTRGRSEEKETGGS